MYYFILKEEREINRSGWGGEIEGRYIPKQEKGQKRRQRRSHESF